MGRLDLAIQFSEPRSHQVHRSIPFQAHHEGVKGFHCVRSGDRGHLWRKETSYHPEILNLPHFAGLNVFLFNIDALEPQRC